MYHNNTSICSALIQFITFIRCSRFVACLLVLTPRICNIIIFGRNWCSGWSSSSVKKRRNFLLPRSFLGEKLFSSSYFPPIFLLLYYLKRWALLIIEVTWIVEFQVMNRKISFLSPKVIFEQVIYFLYNIKIVLEYKFVVFINPG